MCIDISMTVLCKQPDGFFSSLWCWCEKMILVKLLFSNVLVFEMNGKVVKLEI